MRPQRLVELSLAAALDRGEPLGPALAAVAPVKREAAAMLEAGRLEEGLGAASLDPDLVRLAREWPAALLPAVRGLALLPHRLELLAAPLQTLALLVPLALAQFVLGAQFVPMHLQQTFYYDVGEIIGESTGMVWMSDFLYALLIPALVLFGCLGLFVLMDRGSSMGQAERRSARGALIALALAESAAPAELRRRQDALLGALTRSELLALQSSLLGAAWAAQARQVVLLRSLGFGALALAACLQLHFFYTFLPLLSAGPQP